MRAIFPAFGQGVPSKPPVQNPLGSFLDLSNNLLIPCVFNASYHLIILSLHLFALQLEYYPKLAPLLLFFSTGSTYISFLEKTINIDRSEGLLSLILGPSFCIIGEGIKETFHH